MQLSVKGKQLDVGDAWRRHVEESLPSVVAKYFDNAQDAQVMLSREGSTFRVDITVHVGKRIIVQSHGATGDAYSAFEEAGDHLGKRLPERRADLYEQAVWVLLQRRYGPDGREGGSARLVNENRFGLMAAALWLTARGAVREIGRLDFIKLLVESAMHFGSDLFPLLPTDSVTKAVDHI